MTLPLLPATVAFENLPSAWDLRDGAVRVADGWRLEKLCDRGKQADLFVERFPARLSEAPELRKPTLYSASAPSRPRA